MTYRQILEIVRNMTEEQRQDALKYVLFRYQQDQQEQDE